MMVAKGVDLASSLHLTNSQLDFIDLA